MNQQLISFLTDATAATAAKREEVIQSLWSGYGEIVRYQLFGAEMESVVLKHVMFPSQMNHPRGWNNDISHKRKVRSYEVEMNWYKHWSSRCGESCRIPSCYAVGTLSGQQLILLEDLDGVGYSLRKERLSLLEVKLCLSWLANFHATFMQTTPEGLWLHGSYWHLATRPDELMQLDDDILRDAAPVLDSLLNRCPYKTLLHGDAKVANFCFALDGKSVAAVDFQYVGGGCGMKDVAYLLGSCLSDQDQESFEAELLDYYFEVLSAALAKNKPSGARPAIDCDALVDAWRMLFPVAQADFYRFLAGWMPTHWKINDYNRRVTLEVLASL